MTKTFLKDVKVKEKKSPQKRPDLVEQEAKALRANLAKRKKQIEQRKILEKRKKDSASS